MRRKLITKPLKDEGNNDGSWSDRKLTIDKRKLRNSLHSPCSIPDKNEEATLDFKYNGSKTNTVKESKCNSDGTMGHKGRLYSDCHDSYEDICIIPNSTRHSEEYNEHSESSKKCDFGTLIPQESILEFVIGSSSFEILSPGNRTKCSRGNIVESNNEKKLYDVQRSYERSLSKSSTTYTAGSIGGDRKSALFRSDQNVIFDFSLEHIKTMYAVSDWTSDITETVYKERVPHQESSDHVHVQRSVENLKLL